MATTRRPRRIPNGRSSLPAIPTIPGFINTALVPARASLSDDEAISQMADDMRQASFREGGMTRDGLALLGWTGAQLDRLGAKARERAQRDAVVSL